jgi:ArsR family transcriptional regulator, arsenate/arsenite/antimonite-responsive transcriptional repressor / arsenate reductase (thioredoxin)
MPLLGRVGAHAALGDVKRLAIVDGLALGDRTVSELGDLVGIEGNLLAHHLDVLETAGLIERRVSEGDRRRRYVSLRWEGLPATPQIELTPSAGVVFVCTHNSARSPFAAAIWEQQTGSYAASGGSHPAATVHPMAVEVAAEFGVDLSAAEPAGYEQLPQRPDLVISVCDLARESHPPKGRRTLHWSIPDPVNSATLRSFRTAFSEITDRVDRLAGQSTDKPVP